nr:MAG TPA: hypothetical protein [Caudoviricetes sp.]
MFPPFLNFEYIISYIISFVNSFIQKKLKIKKAKF